MAEHLVNERPVTDPGIPACREERVAVISAAAASARASGYVPPVSVSTLRSLGDEAIRTHGWDPAWLGFAMVGISNALWSDTVASVPPEKCILLLPQCLRHPQLCPGEEDDYGLICAECGSCPIAEIELRAARLGYTTLIAEATAVVEGLLERGRFEAIIGVSCLAALERTLTRMVDRAIPGLAIPLLRDGCFDTDVDIDWLDNVLIRRRSPATTLPFFKLSDMRELNNEVTSWFTEEALGEMLGMAAGTERCAVRWMAREGKRWRPFLVVAVARAIAGDLRNDPGGHPVWPGQPTPTPSDLASGFGHCPPPTQTGLDPEDSVTQAPGHSLTFQASSLRRVAVAIECFHKASLIHDDIEDGDDSRYGFPALHAEVGVAKALNTGDFLIGEGYRLLASAGFAPETTSELVMILAEAQRQLCIGQGTEFELPAFDQPPTVPQILSLFERKTAPAFRVALQVGAIISGADQSTMTLLNDFSVEVGVGYQIRDDLADIEGGEVLAAANLVPSVLVAKTIADDPAGQSLRELFPFRDSESCLRAVDLVKESSAPEWARKMLGERKEAAQLIAERTQIPLLRQLLFRVAGRLVEGQTIT